MEHNDLKLGLTKYIPFTKTRRIWKKQLANEEIEQDCAHSKDFEKDVYLVRRKQSTLVNASSASVILLITALWGLLPHFVNFHSGFSFINLGFDKNHLSWSDDIMLFLVPSGAGAVIHHAPKLIPNKKARLIVDITIKFVPFLIIIVWFIRYEISIHRIKKAAK